MKKWLIIILVILLLLLGTCVGGFLWFSSKVGDFIEAQVGPWPVSLREARDAHQTVLLKSEPFEERLLPSLTHDKLEYTSYEGPLGRMSAIATKITSGKKPAIIWDFGGIFDGYADEHPPYDDQGVRQFLEEDFVVFLPAVRGEHGNPGVFECFYGEVDDLVAAVEHVASRPDVDPNRIFLMGHSTGGTNVLLTSALTGIHSGVVSFGGAIDMGSVVFLGSGYGVEPYDTSLSIELDLRSVNRSYKYIQCPVLDVEGNDFRPIGRNSMPREARSFGVSLQAAIVEGAGHWDVLYPTKRLLIDHIKSRKSGFPTNAEIQANYKNSVQP